ncbi:MAG: hypothetical protein HKN40_06350 [Winogradskyella sp.]|uniref:SOS response-associated peptidase family protein n=1 Tax=Winogradskyella sp. TaxID=1883156 RepID=UPI0017FDD963|nr:hypothetical protein [Winogradskyella sp.]
MFYKLSNTTNLQDIEAAFDARFKYPLLYRESSLINGLSEQSLPVITMDDKRTIDYAIWGILPQNYQDDWDKFQNFTNTLNVSLDTLHKLDWIGDIINTQRCIIIVSGFFTSFLYKGEIHPFYVHDKHKKPFALAGIYSRLEDGFLSVSIVVTDAPNELAEVHNLGKDFPFALNANNYEDWLIEDNDFLNNGIKKIKPLDLKAHAISKEFYKNNIIFDTILEPAHYDNLPVFAL